jgi:hypothetical protein
MGDVGLGEKFPHPMVWDILIALQRAWGILYSPLEMLLILQSAASTWVVVLTRKGMSSQLNLDKVRKLTGGDEPSSQKKILPVTGTKVACVWRGRGLSGRS